MVDASGGTIGVRDVGLIDSAVNRPRATFGDDDLYPSLFDKAAALFHSVIFNHAFLDGNKRTAVASAAQLLYLNGFELITSEKELESFTMKIVDERLGLDEIAKWLEKYSIEC
ncbi:MAG: type II toxin-antitoxin system death-on-curing family toxin [Candidatus Gracilibacteria bacterium]